MILYVNGDEHVAGAHLINNFTWAYDDKQYWALEDRPHPDNLQMSWSANVASLAKLSLMNATRSDCSMTSIIDRTNRWVDNKDPDSIFVIMGFPNPDYDKNESFMQIIAQDELLSSIGVKHLLFMTNPIQAPFEYTLSSSIVHIPYTTFLREMEAQTTILSDIYYDKKAHAMWSNYLLQYIAKHKLL